MTEIGFVGIGNMGLPMVANLVKAGFAVQAYDVRREAVEAAVGRGAGCNAVIAPTGLSASGGDQEPVCAVNPDESRKT